MSAPRIIILLIILICLHTTAMSQLFQLKRLVRNGEYHQAAQKLLAISKPLPDKKEEQYQLLKASIYYHIGEFKKAEYAYDAALEEVEKRRVAGKRLRLQDYTVMDEAALFLVYTGNYQKSRELIEESLSSRIHPFNKHNPTNYRPYLPLGLLFLKANELDSAKKYLIAYQKVIRNSNYTGFLDINRYADIFQLLSELELETNPRQALRYAHKADRLQNHSWTKRESGKNYRDRITSLATLARIYRLLGDEKRSNKYTKKSFQLNKKRKVSDDHILIPSYLNQAWLNLRNDPKLALKAIRIVMSLHTEFINSNFDYLSEYEKINAFESIKDVSNEVYSVLIELLQSGLITDLSSIWGEALNYVFQTKGIILNESNRVFEFISKSEDQDLKNKLSEWRRLKNQWAGASDIKNTSDLRPNLKGKIVALEKELNRTSSFLSSTDKVVWSEVKSKLVSEECLIELLRVNTTTGPQYLFFIVSGAAESPQVGVIQNGQELEESLFSYYHNSITYQTKDTLTYTHFWKPIEDKIQNSKKLFFSADGIYHLLNIPTIRISDSVFLCDKLDVVQLVCGRDLINRSHEDVLFHSAILFGAPDYTHTATKAYGLPSVAELPGAAAEVQALDTLLTHAGIAVEVYSDKSCTESRIKQRLDADIVHLATHGFYLSGNSLEEPMLGSGLLFATDPDEADDGVLTAWEASTLDLSETKLVVLSACNTGLGAIHEGEGIFGLQRAFQLSGVRYLMMSLWEVDDQVTKEMMVLFYRNLIDGFSTKEAFVKTQNEIRKSYQSPYYWGAFKLMTVY